MITPLWNKDGHILIQYSRWKDKPFWGIFLENTLDSEMLLPDWLKLNILR